MEKTIKYLENGEYHYATVKDVGDLAKLKTDSKDDLVTAINELFITGGEGPKKPDGYDELVDNVADAIQKQQQMTDTITNMQQSAQLSDAEMQHMKQVQEELHQEYLKALKELNEAVDKAKADAADLDKKTSDLQDKLDETFANVEKEVSDVHKQLDSESAGLRKDLDDTKTSLESTRKDLLNNTQEFGVVNSEVKELKDKMDRRVWSTDLDPVREQVNKNTTEVSQTKDELKNKADQSSLDLVTNSVENLSTQVKENADGLKVSVKKDELGGDVAKLLNDKTNLLLGTRSFSGEDNWENRDTATIEPGYYKGLKSAAIQSTDSSIYQPYHIKANTAYTFSFFGKEDRDNPKATLIIKPIDAPNINIDNAEQPVHITTEWQRFAVTFSADQDCDISIQIIQGPEASNNILHLAGFKLQYGQNNTPWEPNEADVAENIEHNESQFNVYSDQIAGIVKKQEKMGDTERQLDTRITETAEGLKQTSKDLQDANGKITEFKGQLESTAQGLKTEYEKYTNDAIGQISDSSLNLIRNSAFQNKDDSFAQWQNVSAKANVREDSNGLRWVEITQSGMTTSNPQGITSNYFNVKQGKVTVAVDIKSGDKAELDNESVLFLELYDNAKKRVDFHWVTLSDLGLSKSLLNDHQVHRGLYRLAIDRTDAQYMTVKAHLIRNGDLWFTNFSARLSSIDDGGYTPNPDDVNQQILKQNTKIEQDAKQIALKANSVDVTRDIKSAVDGIRVGGQNLANGTDKEYTMGYGIPNTTWQNGYAYESLPTKILTREILPQNGQFFVTLIPGKEYTQTIWLETDADVRKLNAAITWFTNVGHDEQPAKIIKVGENSYKLFSTYTWPGKTDNNVRLFDIFYLQDAFDLSTGTYIKFGKLKLEEGNVSTDWTPSLQDTSEEIKSAKDAAIQVASDQINIHVNEISTSFDDKLNKRVNEVKTASEKFTSDGIELVVTKVTDVKNDINNVNSKLDNLQVGTRNLLHHSDTFDGWHKGSSVSISSEKYLNGSVAVLQNSGSGGNALYSGLDVTNDEKHITWTVYARADNNGDKLHTELWGGGGLTDRPLTTEWKRYKFAGDHADTYNSFYLWGVNTNKGNIYVALPFAVVGNTIGSWSPNPDDVNQSIKDATEYKTVTGTIDFNNLKTQQKIFYKDTQATNTPAGGNYWYYLDVEPGTDGRIFQTAISDRDNITWVRTFADSWGPWIRQADQRNVDDLNNQISSFKTETTASVKNLGDRVTTEVNSVTTKINNKIDGIQVGGRNILSNTENLVYKAKVTNSTNNPNSGDSMWKLAVGNLSDWLRNNPDVKEIAISYDYELQGATPTGTIRFGVNQAPVWEYMSSFNLQGKPAKGRVKLIVPVTDNMRETASNISRIRGDGLPIGATLIISHPKWEIGNKVTDWSPAPEDTIEAISEVNTKWDVANGQIQGKVTATDVNNILNGKGYATQSWAQSQFRMKSDSIDLEVKKITDPISNKINSVNEKDGINLLKGTSDFTGSWFRCDDASWTDDNWRDTNGNRVRKRSGSAWNGLGQTVHLEPGNYTFSMDMYLNLGTTDTLNFYAGDTQYNGTPNIVQLIDGNRYDHNSPQGSWFRAVCHFKVTEAGNVAIRPELNQGSGTVHVGSYKLEKGLIATPWTPAPSDNASVTQISSLQVSIDGLQSTVSNKADKSQITHLSNMIQSKVSSTDFNNLRKAVDLQTLDSADINNMKTNGHYFVRNLANNPVGGWVYVDVTGNGADRIRQDVYQDNGNKHKYRRWFGTYWTGWEEGATESEITQLRDDINLRVKSGDLLSQINLTAHNTLIQSGKIYLDSSSTVFSGKAFIPSAAIVSLDADKINTGTLNTRTVSIGDDQTRLWARSNYLYLTGKDQGNAYNMRLGGDRIEFVTTEIPNNAPYMDGITPMYQIAYDGDTKSRLKIRSFNRLTGSNEFPIEMYDSVNISKDQLDFAANNQMKMQVVDGGVNIRPTLFLQNNTRNGTWTGFTRLDNSDTVEFNTGNNNGENFHVNSGARFRQYLYVDGWLSCYQLKQTSLLSEKTDIEELDPEEALNMVRQDKQYLYKYKQDVQKGIIDQQAGLIIDDQNNTPVYTPPKVFLDSTGKSREPNVELAYLIAAFQELDRRNQKLERDIRELKGEVIHE